MYNVPYQVADYTAEPAQQPQNSTNDRYPQAGHPPSSLAPPPTSVAGAIDPSSLTTHGLANHLDQDGVKKDSRASSFSYIPLNAPSPIPSNSSVAKAAGIHPTDTSSADKHHARSASLNYDMYSPSPTFKRPSSAERKDDALYYPPPNDPWMAGATGANAQTQDDDDDEPTSVLDDGSVPQQHMQQLFEKKRRRRESHNAVERRRRDNINERIYELSTMLPERDATKNTKGTILRKSVEHIQRLHEELAKSQQRIQELEHAVGMYRMRVGDLGGASALDLQQRQQPQPPMMGYPSMPTQLPFRRDG